MEAGIIYGSSGIRVSSLASHKLLLQGMCETGNYRFMLGASWEHIALGQRGY